MEPGALRSTKDATPQQWGGDHGEALESAVGWPLAGAGRSQDQGHPVAYAAIGRGTQAIGGNLVGVPPRKQQGSLQTSPRVGGGEGRRVCTFADWLCFTLSDATLLWVCGQQVGCRDMGLPALFFRGPTPKGEGGSIQESAAFGCWGWSRSLLVLLC